jgi:transposase
MCKTVRAILHALAQGKSRPEVLADLALLRVPGKRDTLVPALQGCLRPHHRFVLGELLVMIATQEHAIARLDAERLRPLDELLARLDGITGVSQGAFEILFAEVGWDPSPFPDSAHLASWVGICPGQHESGGKWLSGRIRNGNRWAKTTLVQATHAAGRTKIYLGAQFRHLSRSRGKSGRRWRSVTALW